MYVVTWDFLPAPGYETAFERTYGSAGDWARLFAQAQGFLDTTCQPLGDRPGWFRTVDRWESELAYLGFRARFQAQYLALDHRCEELTAVERHVATAELP